MKIIAVFLYIIDSSGPLMSTDSLSGTAAKNRSMFFTHLCGKWKGNFKGHKVTRYAIERSVEGYARRAQEFEDVYHLLNQFNIELCIGMCVSVITTSEVVLTTSDVVQKTSDVVLLILYAATAHSDLTGQIIVFRRP